MARLPIEKELKKKVWPSSRTGLGSIKAGAGKVSGTLKVICSLEIFSSASSLGIFTSQTWPVLTAMSVVSYSILKRLILSFPTTLLPNSKVILVMLAVLVTSGSISPDESETLTFSKFV